MTDSEEERFQRQYQAALDDVEEWIHLHIEEFKSIGLVNAEQELALQRLDYEFKLAFQYRPYDAAARRGYGILGGPTTEDNS